MKSRTIVVGDVHGCYDELMALMEKVDLGEKDRVVCVGDLITKGPKSKEVLELFMTDPRYSTVIGNHDLALRRKWNGEDIELNSAQKEAHKELKGEKDAYASFFNRTPFTIDLDTHLVVHAGLRPNVELHSQTTGDMTRLRTLGPVLFLGHARYHGPELRFEDGTLLRDNDPIGRLHFNNASIAALGEGSMQRVGFRFAKLMRESLRTLAEVAQSDPSLRDVAVFQGMTWLPAHGEVVGFVSTPMPKNWRTRLLARHFRLLMSVFAPSARIRERGKAEPRLYWLTRTALVRNLNKLKSEPTAGPA